MKKKIILCVIILAIFMVYRPSFQFLQKMEIKKQEKITEKNNVDLSKLRRNPQKYFPILLEKSKQIDNLYMSYNQGDIQSALFQELYIKNNLKKEVDYTKAGNAYKPTMTRLNLGKKVYIYLSNKSMFAFDMSKDKLFAKESLPWPMLSIPRENFNQYKFIGLRKYNERTCALWNNKSYIQASGVTCVYNRCLDEELGVGLYHTMQCNSNNKIASMITVKEIRTEKLNEEEFYFPKSIKGILKGKIALLFGAFLL